MKRTPHSNVGGCFNFSQTKPSDSIAPAWGRLKIGKEPELAQILQHETRQLSEMLYFSTRLSGS